VSESVTWPFSYIYIKTYVYILDWHVLRRLVTFCNEDVLLSAYYALILPHLRYAVAIWGSAYDTSNIFILQKTSIWTLTLIFKKKKQESCKPIFQNYQMLMFLSIYIYKTLLFVKQNLSLFIRPETQNNHNHTSRYHNTLKVTSHQTTFYQKQLKYREVILFN